MSVEQFTIPRNTIENIEAEKPQEKLNYPLSKEQKRLMAMLALNLSAYY